ncbi:MAG TPA: peptidylprolyl isomerase, partial [Crenalkalicoccus sp.]|nr:peptidylprolyl isomerase [Crenalkalicoccus sp.]
PEPGTLLARRGALTLTDAMLRAMLDREPEETRATLLRDPAALGQWVRGRMLRLMLLQEAAAAQFDQRPEVKARAEEARQAAIADAYLESLSRPDPDYPGEAELRAAYEASRARLMQPRQYHLAQIFLAVPPGAPPTREKEAERRLKELRAQATAPRNRVEFAELARRHSEERGTAAQGGDLGWVPEDRLLPAIREAVAGLPEGAIGEPLRTADGWHLIRMLGTRPAAPAPFEEVRERLATALRRDRENERARLALNEMLRREPVQIDEIQLARFAEGARKAAEAAR